MAAGVAGVVAMRYNVYVFTAAQFVANLYTALAQGQGNPMTITAVVGQALRNGFRTREQIEEFVFQLRSGELV
jgi:hypothetical protein